MLVRMAGPDDGKLVPTSGTALANDDFEMRFLELAHKSTAPLTIASVAYQLKLPTTQVEARLEELAARDIIVRDVDDEGNLIFRLPGKGGALASAGGAKAPISAGASAGSLNGLLVNFVLPGVGSLMVGKPIEGIAQIALVVVGIGLLVTLHFIGIPLIVAGWIWGVVTGFRNLK
jgi:TM2 domain-containing membrane protein YozV